MNPSNCTLSAIAAGTFDQSCKILCKPAKWNDLVIFYIGNYIAHAVTVRNPPGQSTFGAISMVVTALLFPVSGLVEGVRAITSLAVFAKTPLRSAARAGALYMVVEVEKDDIGSRRMSVQEPEGMEDSNNNQLAAGQQSINARDVELQDINTVEHLEGGMGDDSTASAQNEADIEAQLNQAIARQPLERPPKRKFGFFTNNSLFNKKIHGRVSLPSGWELVKVPWDAMFEDDDAMPENEKVVAIQISQDYSVTKSAIALGQTLYAISTLYNTRGNQIQQFGYAAFGFTVIPYAFMSIMNLLGNLVCPEFPTMYVVESEGREVLHVVEVIIYEVAMFALIGIHVGFIGRFTKFHKEESTYAQRVWMMTWLGFGTLIGFVMGSGRLDLNHRSNRKDSSKLFFGMIQHANEKDVLELYMGIFYGALAGGGVVVVGQMILQLGICERI